MSETFIETTEIIGDPCIQEKSRRQAINMGHYARYELELEQIAQYVEMRPTSPLPDQQLIYNILRPDQQTVHRKFLPHMDFPQPLH